MCSRLSPVRYLYILEIQLCTVNYSKTLRTQHHPCTSLWVLILQAAANPSSEIQRNLKIVTVSLNMRHVWITIDNSPLGTMRLDPTTEGPYIVEFLGWRGIVPARSYCTIQLAILHHSHRPYFSRHQMAVVFCLIELSFC